MRPLRLEMQGFGAFRSDTVVDFTDIDLVALVGDTGSGKSTVIDAVTFALYGSIARYDDNRAVAPIINQTSNQAQVRLDFEVSDETYTAVRIVRRTPKGASTKEARLERGDEVLASDARGMSTAVEGLLGLDVEQFNRTVVLPQGRFADFLHDKPGDRQETLRHLLGLEMYQEIARRARSRARRARDQIDALSPGLDEADELTDERRQQLSAKIRTFEDVMERFGALCHEIDELDGQITELDGQLATHRERRSRLDTVHVPDDTDVLEQEITNATGAVVAAETAVKEVRERRRQAAEGVRTGPDLATINLQRQAHETVGSLTTEFEQTSNLLGTAQSEFEKAAERAAAVRAEQERLDAAVSAARDAEGRARDALSGTRTTGEIDQLLRLHEQRAQAIDDVSGAETQVAAAWEVFRSAEARLQEAAESEADARRIRDDLRQRAGAAGLVNLLAVGEPCPLCLQTVHEIPEHHIDDELAATEERLAATDAALRHAVGVRDAARTDHGKIEARLEAARRSLQQVDDALVDVPTVDVLTAERATVIQLTDAAAEATNTRQKAGEAAEEYRDRAENRDALERESAARDQIISLTARADDLAERLKKARDQVAGTPSMTELDEMLEEAQRRAKEQDDASEACDEAERRLDGLRESLGSVAQRAKQARRDLEEVRDGLADMRPPALPGNSLADDWAALTEWATASAADLDSSIAQIEHAQRELSERRSVRDRDARTLCADALVNDASTPTLTELTTALTRGHADAENELERFDADRDRLSDLRQRIGGLEEQATVAETLAHLLRVDGFERWLMGAALRRLAAAASVRLFELSGGQYSLELSDRSFDVRDHTNADELRGTRTLSGGETFLASLSLALALADATAELAPEGAPQLESIFLDEGFGTLDSQTLDTVAAAIEELGASGRLVGIITHIRELADRMPVRLEVTKVGGSSGVERIEV